MKKELIHLCIALVTFGLFMVLCTTKNSHQEDQSHTDSLTLKVMTFNMRYDNPDDGNNRWGLRIDSIKQMIEAQAPDLIGGQEVLKNMLADFTEALPQYTSLGVGREDGVDRGEYGPIFYKTDKFTLNDSGYFWLRPDSLHPGKGWDAGCERIVTWAVLQDKSTLRSFLYLNTHLDNAGQEARHHSVGMILSAIDRLCQHDYLPVILTGDFNSEPDDQVITALTDKDAPIHLTDARTIAQETHGPSWTFHDFGKIPLDQRPLIDYIFLKGNIDVSDYTVISEPDTPNHVYLSDHSPIIVTLTINS